MTDDITGRVVHSQDRNGERHTDYLYRDSVTGVARASRFAGVLTIQQAIIGLRQKRVRAIPTFTRDGS